MSPRQEDFTDFLSLYSKDEPKDNINAASTYQDDFLDFPSLSPIEQSGNMEWLSLPHLEDVPEDKGFPVSQDFTDFLSPQINIEPEAKDLTVSRQEHLPDISSSPSKAKPNKGLSASTRQDNFTDLSLNVEPQAKTFAVSSQQDSIQPSPRFKKYLTDDTHSISSHQPSAPNVNLDTDEPPKYVSQRINPIRRRQIPNYPHSTAPLPTDIGSEELITSYPNHLHGQTLLNLLETWTPSEIAETCPAKEINKGMISTRVKYARQRLVAGYQPRGRMNARVEKAEQKTKKRGKGKGKEAAIEAALKEAKSGTASMGATQIVAKESGSLGIAQPVNGYRRVNYRNPFDD